MDTHEELEALAQAVARLRPDWRDGEAFYERRSDVVGRLRALARSPLAIRTVVRFVQAAPPGQGAPEVRSHDDTAPTLAAAAPAPCRGRTAPPARKRPSRRHRFPMPPTSGERGLL